MYKQWFTDLAVHVRPDLETGLLYWRIPGHRRTMSKSIGYITLQGYVYCQFNGIKFFAHQAIFYFIHGYWPTMIDHINRHPNDNRPINLRRVTPSENLMNRGPASNNITGVCGVHLTPYNKYRVRIGGNDYGNFRTLEEAEAIAKAVYAKNR